VLHCVVVAAVVRRDDRGCGGWFDEDGSGGSCGEAGLVGGDVIDGVGCDLGRVDLYGAHFSAIDVCRDAEVEVSLRARDCRAEVVVGSADLHDCRVVAVYLDHRPGVDATAVARDADWCDEVAVGGRACGEADARCCSADVSWPAADMASWAINSIEDVIELQSWSVSSLGRRSAPRPSRHGQAAQGKEWRPVLLPELRASHGHYRMPPQVMRLLVGRMARNETVRRRLQNWDGTMTSRIELISISVETIAFFCVTIDLYGKHRLRAATKKLQGLGMSVATKSGGLMRNFLGLRMDYPLGLPGIVYVFVVTPLFYAIAYMVFFSEGVRTLFLRGDAFANSLIVIGRILAVIMVAGMSMYTLLFALVALGTLGVCLLQRLHFSGFLLAIGTILFVAAKGMLWWHYYSQ
jgi:hypothetical protein